jgi:hypothetical protein
VNDLPEPLTPAEIDLTGFPSFGLNVERLLASELVALCSPQEGWAALMLWSRAWQQKPPGSLPNDERVLAAFSRAKSWKQVRVMALRGFVLCSDGRLYHPMLAAEAMRCWESRLKHQELQAKNAEKLRLWREKQKSKNPQQTGDVTGYEDGTETGSVTGYGPGKRGKGIGEGEGEGEKTLKQPETVVSGADAPELSPADALFQVAVPWLISRDVADKTARSLLGGARKQLGDEGAWALASECIRIAPLEPTAWLAAAINSRISKRSSRPNGPLNNDDENAKAAMLLFGNETEVIDG